MKSYHSQIKNKEYVYELWKKSNVRSVFTNPKILSYYHDDIKYLVILKKEVPVCFFPFIEKRKKLIYPGSFYYFGPIWFEKISKLYDHSSLDIITNCYDTLFNFLEKNFEKYEFMTHFNINEIRPIKWINSEKNLKLKFEPMYTALIDNLQNESLEKIKTKFRNLRKRQIKKINIYENDLVKYEPTINEIFDLYIKSIKLNTNEKNKFKKNLIFYQKIINLNHGKIFCYKDKKNSDLAGLCLLIFDDLSSHLILNIVNKEWKNFGLMQKLILDCLKFSKEKKLKIFDFNGANSRSLSDDKQSYGSIPQLYFKITKN